MDITDQTLGGHVRMNIAVTAVVGLGDARSAQIVLDDLMSKTIPDAVAKHATDVWAHAIPISINPPRPSPEGDRISVDLNFQITA